MQNPLDNGRPHKRYPVYQDLAISSELPTADNYRHNDLRCLHHTLAENRISVPERPQVYKKPHGLLLFVKKSAQAVDCFRCTVAVANRPTRSLACSLDVRRTLLQHAQAGTSLALMKTPERDSISSFAIDSVIQPSVVILRNEPVSGRSSGSVNEFSVELISDSSFPTGR